MGKQNAWKLIVTCQMVYFHRPIFIFCLFCPAVHAYNTGLNVHRGAVTHSPPVALLPVISFLDYLKVMN